MTAPAVVEAALTLDRLIEGPPEPDITPLPGITTPVRPMTVTGANANPVIWNAWNQHYRLLGPNWSTEPSGFGSTFGGGFGAMGVCGPTGATGCATTSTGSAATIWYEWNRCYVQDNIIELDARNYQIGVYPALAVTEEEKAAHAARLVAWQQEQETRRQQAAVRTAERKLKQDAAQQRAEELLGMVLTEAQLAERQQYAYFTVYNAKSQRYYRVGTSQGRWGNITEVDAAGNRLRRFCVAPSLGQLIGGAEPIGHDGHHGMPDADAWVGQKMFLEHDEETFLKHANVVEVFRPRETDPTLPGVGAPAAATGIEGRVAA